MNTLITTHKGFDLLFVNIPKNLPMPIIFTDVPIWNKLHESYYECLFAFTKSNFYDHDVMSLPIVRVPMFPEVFLIGHTLTTFISPKIGLV